MIYDGDTITVGDHDFRVTFPHDDDQTTPWEREDGHGPVSDWTLRAKAPGEMLLCSGRSANLYYDFAEAVKIAKRDGWDAAPFSDSETAGQRAAKAALADFNHLRRFCNDQWSYVGIVVEMLDEDGEPMGLEDSLWGVESDCEEYLEEVARDLAEGLLPAATFHRASA